MKAGAMKADVKRILRHSLTRFLGFSTVGFAFDLALVAALTRFTPLSAFATVSIAFWVTYALNFVLNRYFAFAAHHRPVGPQLKRFVVQVLGDYVLTVAGVLALQRLGLPIVPARVAAAGTNLVFNYLLYRFWTFSGRSAQTERADPPESAGQPVPVASPL
jgi:putative flippase GtrA